MAWSIEQRLAFIESCLYWEGQINRRDLEAFFDISTPQASSIDDHPAEPHWRWITPHALGFDGFRWHIRA